MQQVPQGHYEDPYRSRSMDHRRPEQFIQSQDQYREYRRPDFRDDTFTNFQQEMQNSAGKGNQKNASLGNNHGGNNHGGNNHGGNNHGGNNHGGNSHGGNNHAGNNHGGNNHGGGSQKKQQKYDSDEEYDDFTSNQRSGNKSKGGHDSNNHSHGNKGINGHGLNQNTRGWSDNTGFHGGHKSHHRRSLSLTQILLKKLGLRDDSSSDSSDDERYGSKLKSKGHGHGGHGKADQKPYTVRFDDQSYGHGSTQKHKGVHDLGEDHHSNSLGFHGKKGGNGGGHGGGHGGQLQGILKKSKNNEGYSSEEENRGQKHKGGNNQQHGGSESGKKGGQPTGKVWHVVCSAGMWTSMLSLQYVGDGFFC